MSKLPFKAEATSANVNNSFLGRDVDDTASGVLTLDETISGNSGSTVSNLQRQINLAKKIVYLESAKDNGDTVTLDDLSLNQEVRVVGNAGAVTLNVLPFTNAKVVEDGCEITLVGGDDTNTVTLSLNDVQYGCYINGDATLKKGYTITLSYNDEQERYLEKSRNF